MIHVLRSACVALAITLVASAGHAQVLVSPQQNLQFGLLTPGVATTVAPTDIGRRGAWSIDTRGKYVLSFILPSHLQNVAGGTIPLVFGAADARVEIRGKITTFNPHDGVSIHINPADQDGQVYIGGRAQPAVNASAGGYTAVIVLLVVQTGT